jgi:hypothetical protein
VPDNLTELAERCATATGPNQTLDYCIAEAAVFDADKDYSKEEAYGDTIALALCAAALRMRAKGVDQ